MPDVGVKSFLELFVSAESFHESGTSAMVIWWSWLRTGSIRRSKRKIMAERKL